MTQRPEGSDFWSRRRAGVRAEAEQEELVRAEAEAAELEAQAEEKSDAELLEELDLPDPDTLTAGDDFSAFMKEAVPQRLRTRALRQLWRTNPVLANLDQLVDYGEDFTDSALVVENLQTAYQVGKGMMKHVIAMAEQAAEADAPEAPQEELALVEEEEHLPDDTPEEADQTPETAEPEGQRFDEETAPQPRRRMRFEFASAPEQELR
ncbi:DUF3306 domain-containing protein [Actibacterium lipolyticum]|uniref:DUF3306 domain-containing protein n=1 Tax=Actibacterium lipolyticum TaxID=1524263 RepID=A0A238KNX5_9RHOB|nr:DUF3306 domain-containing protein [Actibacterium lipolyticum]SMX44330.1 hypothetical protein COL8621_02529 [Actibacterium lipolyticum]